MKILKTQKSSNDLSCAKKRIKINKRPASKGTMFNSHFVVKIILLQKVNNSIPSFYEEIIALSSPKEIFMV